MHGWKCCWWRIRPRVSILDQDDYEGWLYGSEGRQVQYVTDPKYCTWGTTDLTSSLSERRMVLDRSLLMPFVRLLEYIPLPYSVTEKRLTPSLVGIGEVASTPPAFMSPPSDC